MQVEDYMNETPLRLLEMLTQTREDLWRAAQALTERGVTRIILTGSGTSYHGALTARAFMQRWCALPVDVCWPFMLDDETLARSGKALVVGISRAAAASQRWRRWSAPAMLVISPPQWLAWRLRLSTGRRIISLPFPAAKKPLARKQRLSLHGSQFDAAGARRRRAATAAGRRTAPVTAAADGEDL